jgi:DNA polymerase-3 subunit delta'
MSNILPWQNNQWSQLLERRNNATLQHAILMNGPTGLGKMQFAVQLSNALLCYDPDDKGEACGQCSNCKLLQAGTHPDLYHVHPEEDSKVIKIDQIRDLREHLSKKSQLSGYKIAIIEPAERMNHNAANSLLKILEEPGEHTLIVLITAFPGLLLATIRSRCQKLSFSPPPSELAVHWLKTTNNLADPELLLSLADGAPLKAVELAEAGYMENRHAFFKDTLELINGRLDPVQLASQWHKEHIAECIDWLSSWVMDMIRIKMASNPPLIANPDILENLKPVSERLDLDVLYDHLDRLTKAYRLKDRQVNDQLLLEDVMIAWAPAA